MRISAKPSTYIIDGLNFVRSYLLTTRYSDEETLISQTALWLDDLSRGALSGSSFRLVLDGGFRDIGQSQMPRVDVVFAEDRTADDIIFEQASYMNEKRLRVCVVTSDGELARLLEERGVKTLSCSQFFKAFY
jgi:predicted RNA-binding protein with PIN domain